MPTTTIHFVRHGKVYNPDHLLYERLPGFHLSDRGMRMAQATAHTSQPTPAQHRIRGLFVPAGTHARNGGGDPRIAEFGTWTARRGTAGTQTDERLIEARNEFRGKRIGFGEGALWKNGNWKLVRNLWKPSWGESYQSIAQRMRDFALKRRWRISRQTDRGGQPRIADLELPAHAGNRAPRTHTCCCATPRSLRSPPSLTTAIRAR